MLKTIELSEMLILKVLGPNNNKIVSSSDNKAYKRDKFFAKSKNIKKFATTKYL